MNHWVIYPDEFLSGTSDGFLQRFGDGVGWARRMHQWLYQSVAATDTPLAQFDGHGSVPVIQTDINKWCAILWRYVFTACLGTYTRELTVILSLVCILRYQHRFGELHRLGIWFVVIRRIMIYQYLLYPWMFGELESGTALVPFLAIAKWSYQTKPPLVRNVSSDCSHIRTCEVEPELTSYNILTRTNILLPRGGNTVCIAI